MYSLYFDPFLLAAPLGNDKDSFYEHIKNLLNWRDICQEKWINGYLPLETVNILTMANCYPFKENLQKSMNHYEILDIQIQDVIKVINQLMFELNYIEDIQYYTQFEIKEFISQEKIFIEKRNNYFLDSIFKSPRKEQNGSHPSSKILLT